MLKHLIPAYLIIINAAALLLMLIDKQKAKHGKWRISEKTLIGTALLGGSIGAILGMNIFRHKTKHPKFSIGLPLILAVQIMLCVLFLMRFL